MCFALVSAYLAYITAFCSDSNGPASSLGNSVHLLKISMRNFLLSLCIGAALLGSVVTASAQQAGQTTASAIQPSAAAVSYQGVIAKDGVLAPDGDYQITFSLYHDANGASTVWTGTYSVHTSNGIFNVMLGSGDYPLPEPAKLDGALFLGVKIGDDAEMSRTELYVSTYVMNVTNGSITVNKSVTDSALYI
jgi:hypothetical protein